MEWRSTYPSANRSEKQKESGTPAVEGSRTTRELIDPLPVSRLAYGHENGAGFRRATRKFLANGPNVGPREPSAGRVYSLVARF